MDLLENAVQSIQVGVEDYGVGSSPRLLPGGSNHILRACIDKLGYFASRPNLYRAAEKVESFFTSWSAQRSSLLVYLVNPDFCELDVVSDTSKRSCRPMERDFAKKWDG